MHIREALCNNSRRIIQKTPNRIVKQQIEFPRKLLCVNVLIVFTFILMFGKISTQHLFYSGRGKEFIILFQHDHDAGHFWLALRYTEGI